MRVDLLGERKLIELLTEKLYRNKSIISGAGEDDAALLKFNGKQLALTSDIMFHSTHFPPSMKSQQIGRKIAVANLSDLAAVGAKPLGMLFSFGIPPQLDFRILRGIIKGINLTCSEYNAPFIGGDTKKAKELTICGIALGEIIGKPMRRCNAREGDIVAVTGEIGDAFLGLRIVKEGVDSKKYEKLKNAFLNPKARVREGIAIAELGVRAAGMDITDGLLFSAGEIARMSRVCLSLDSEKIPISKEAEEFTEKHEISRKTLLNNGEDYELIITLSEREFEKVRKKVTGVGGELIEIGRAIEGRGVLLDGRKVNTNGYDSFINKRKGF
ncbi:MAG: thiamine-phosphate kinase [Candidatus Micrarchaeia archaeon]